MSIEANFNVPFVASLALREKQIQQNYRPIIAVHKWFARRPGTLFRSLLLAEFGSGPLESLFYKANDLKGLLIADPFMGGGTPLLEANRLGCDVMGFDVNPMAAWIVREEIEHLDLDRYSTAAEALLADLTAEVGPFYKTDCPLYGDASVPVKYFLWVKTRRCESCCLEFDLFPGYLLADDSRHPKHVVVCSRCGDLNEVDDIESPGDCPGCHTRLIIDGPAKRGRCNCPKCGQSNRYPDPVGGPPRHRLFAIEYYNPKRKRQHLGRFFKKPDLKDLAVVAEATERWTNTDPEFVPDNAIPPGDETTRLHKWGYSRYRELFNPRQLVGLELSCRRIAANNDERIRRALATNLSDLLRYQNMLCRYDTASLKSLDIFSVHGFPVGLVQCESNLLGITGANGIGVGSGGWSNIIEKYSKAKRYCDQPFEVRYAGRRKTVVPIAGEWIGERRNGGLPRSVSINCMNSADATLTPESLDAVFTDPPYYGNVQYGELMDFCYIWLRGLAAEEGTDFAPHSSRSRSELTGNVTQSRGLEHFTEGLSEVFRVFARALKPNAPLAFTFHHNQFPVYHAIGVAILDAGLLCTASPPCPAEMSGSIHISGTGSSITDTVFVCRKPTVACNSAEPLDETIADDVAALSKSGMRINLGDARCLAMGHATRMAILSLHHSWNAACATSEKLQSFARAILWSSDLEQLVSALPLESHEARRSGTAHTRNRKQETTRSLF